MMSLALFPVPLVGAVALLGLGVFLGLVFGAFMAREDLRQASAAHRPSELASSEPVAATPAPSRSVPEEGEAPSWTQPPS